MDEDYFTTNKQSYEDCEPQSDETKEPPTKKMKMEKLAFGDQTPGNNTNASTDVGEVKAPGTKEDDDKNRLAYKKVRKLLIVSYQYKY